MAKLGNADMQRYALLGAEKRLAELDAEAAQIFRSFPALRSRRRRMGGAGDTDSAPRAQPRRRRKLSPEGRRRISEAQKARWAKHKAEHAGAGESRKKK
jgi:hypothetical protein